ncbi:MAG: zinc ribbon domain-containing protein [Acidobacteria bacterium]|nr:zinc ribbon domain-containing protein [Acidobacteriota bacterium]HQZ39664.1 zinc ribbon domain-containing protein [Vicinamibacterales bacterium]
MPLYEYVCRSCHQQFELLVRASTDLACPRCHGTELDKQLSVFAVSTTSGERQAAVMAPGPCGGCGHPGGPGSCGAN